MARILFLGMSGVYSALALRTLVQEGAARGAEITLAAVVLPQFESLPGLTAAPSTEPLRWVRWDGPAGGPRVPSLRSSGLGSQRGLRRPITLPQAGDARSGDGSLAARTTRQVARELGAPLLEVANLSDARVRAELARLAPDAIVVACLPWRVPAVVLRLPRLGILNLHPSLLPAHRGPDPLFWTFREGQRETGATVHLMTAAFDAGPILAQEPLPVPDGISEGSLERECALVAGRLAVSALQDLARGTATPRLQDEAVATYDPLPTMADYQIYSSRSARWAFNFAAGLRDRPEPVWLDLQDGPGVGPGGMSRWRILTPLGCEDDADLGMPWQFAGDVLALQCAPGIFRARVASLALASEV